jgi:phosphoribosyl-AMP cyclohydrolase / phosphoribosyl-ATP pyrophosphohydrolase
MEALLQGIRFDERGLAPCVVQDWRTGEILMLAWVNAEAIERSHESGEMHFFSRSRGRLWRKGEESGNVQRVRQLRYDCDGDAVVALVEPAGPACHTGERSCFYREVGGVADPAVDAPRAPGEPRAAPFEALGRLERVIADRDRDRPAGSYTATLLADPERIGAKVGEEAEEVIRAASSESEERLAEESADLIYHLAVLTRSRGLDLAAALEVLNGRRDG